MLESSAKQHQDVLLTSDATSKLVFGWDNPFPMNPVQKILFLICDYPPSTSRLSALQRHNTENSKQMVQEKELRGFSPNSYIHVSVSDLYIPLIGLPILLQENRWTERGNI